LYAFNIIPAKKLDFRELIASTTAQISECPYASAITIVPESEINRSNDEPTLQYFYDADHIKKMNEINDKKQMDKKRRMEAAQNRELEPCWFCLGGSKVERHYIVSVGNKSYLAYAKGALNADHLLIIPIGIYFYENKCYKRNIDYKIIFIKDHVQSSVHADADLLEDITKYKMALVSYFKAKNKCVIFFERHFRTKHMLINVLAVGMDKSYLLKDAFMSFAKDQDVHLNEIPEFTNLKQVLNANHSFYYLELPNEQEDSLTSHVRYLCEIRGHHFPLNFGRDVIASELLLNMPDRIDWKDCVKSPEEEKKMSVDFRNGEFKKFDPFN
jgi:hypothetical protein